MIARRASSLFWIALLFATSISRAGQVEADPHELYERAQAQLRGGDLEATSTTVSRLRTLITESPQWDPDGAFARELLPSLAARLERVQEAARRLDAFSAQALQDLELPKAAVDFPTLREYTLWATSTIQRLRLERDRIVEAGVQDSEDRACLMQTASYAKTEQLLQTDLLRRASAGAEDEVLGLLSGDPEMETVLVRFRQLKVDLVRSMGEREALEKLLRKSRRAETALRKALVGIVVEDGATGPEEVASGPDAAGKSFAALLDREMEAVRGRDSQSLAERDARRASVERYRRSNRALFQMGVGADQSERIDTLAKAIELTPLRDEPGRSSRLPNFLASFMLVVFALAAGVSTWIAVLRGRALDSARRADAAGIAGPLAEAGSRNRRHDAA